VTPYAQGALHAFKKYAVNAETLRHVADLGGLGLLSIPVMHHLLGHTDQDSPGMQRAMAGTELAGLGLLAAPTIHHLVRA
jgi:hypothetical protein